MDIGFIGIGVMGRSMVANLMKKGHKVTVYSRRKESAKGVVEQGAKWADSIKECVKDADMVISIVGFPKDVEEVYFGKDAILDSAKPGALVVDMTTTSPKLAERIYAAAKEKGLRALDAPVSGGDLGAQKGTLAIMAGGDEDAFNEALPVFEAMGTTIRYEGKEGTGQHTKMANQIAIAGAIAGAAEAVAYARTAGLDPQKMLDTVAGGSGTSWQLVNNGAKMLKEDYAPGFYIKHFIKDMGLAKEEADARGRELPVLKTVLDTFRQLEADGYGDEGTQALIRAYGKKA